MADLFRYCFLYLHGGVSVPMKSVQQVPLYSYMPKGYTTAEFNHGASPNALMC
jgi:hypothetical protein